MANNTGDNNTGTPPAGQPSSGGSGKSTFSPTFLIQNVQHRHFGWILLVLLATIIVLWKLKILESISWSMVLLVIVFSIYSIFVGVGWYTGFKGKTSRIWVAAVLTLWLIDMWPISLIPLKFGGIDLSPYLGWLAKPFTGFQWTGFDLNTTLPAILSSAFLLVLLYVNMVFDIVKKKYWDFIFGFFFIIAMNNLLARFLPRTVYNIPYASLLFLLLFIVGSFITWYLIKKPINLEREFVEWISYMIMCIVFTFFWINTGWMTNMKALLHAIFIVLFGLAYMRLNEDRPEVWRLGIVLLLILDFYGYGFLWSSDYIILKFIPILVMFVLTYTYVKTEGDSYVLAAFIVLITLMLVLSLKAYGYEAQGTVTFNENPGQGDFTDFLNSIGEGFKSFGVNSLDTATGGLYSQTFRSKVEKNQYEALGVYFSNTRLAQPVFYNDEPVTIWTTIKSRTLSEPVAVKFNCSRIEEGFKVWPNTEKEPKDSIYPPRAFTVFTFEDTDAECTFNQDSANPKLETGTNTITLSATYNFETSAYQKLYFIDKERLRTLTRENIQDPLGEFGITDKQPITVYTNGPVELAALTQYLIPVTEGESFNPNLGILLKNRNVITGKDGKALGQWSGKIKRINELVLVLPEGMTIDTNSTVCKPAPFIPITDQRNFCTAQEWCKTCEKTCESEGDPNSQLRQNCKRECESTCIEECNSVFKDDSNAATNEQKLNYNAYRMDTSALYKDNENYTNVDPSRHLTFGCRIKVVPDILDLAVPITTKYVRILARYDYTVEQSIAVNVVQSPYPTLVTKEGFTGEAPRTIFSCSELGSEEKSFLEGYNKYSVQINEAAKVFGGKVHAPEALIAAVISQESEWQSDAVSQCGAAGILQVIPGTARGYGLKVPAYPFEWCPSEQATTCRLEGKKTEVSVCNSCSKDKCDIDNDERFNPEKSINAMANYLLKLFDECTGSVEGAISRYNGGTCSAPAPAHPTYTEDVMVYYQKWQACFARATT